MVLNNNHHYFSLLCISTADLWIRGLANVAVSPSYGESVVLILSFTHLHISLVLVFIYLAILIFSPVSTQDYYGVTFPGTTATMPGRDGLANNPYSGKSKLIFNLGLSLSTVAALC